MSVKGTPLPLRALPSNLLIVCVCVCVCAGVCVQFQLSSSDSLLYEQERGGMEKSQILLEISHKLPVHTRTATGGQETRQNYNKYTQQ